MLSRFDYLSPQCLEDALSFLKQNSGTKILAGGTDLMVMLRRNAERPLHVLDIKLIPETLKLEYKLSEGLFIGASVTVNQISEDIIVTQRYKALKMAADSLASYQLRNRATLVGNICNASPGADLAGPLLVYNAKVIIAGSSENRTVEISDFFTGVKKTVLKNDEIVMGVLLEDVTDADESIFYKQARIKGHDLGIAALTARRSEDRKISLAMTAVAPTPIRLKELEVMLASKLLTDELIESVTTRLPNVIKPISDVRASREYRIHVSGVLLGRALKQLLELGGE